MKKVILTIAMFIGLSAQSQIQVTQTKTEDLFRARGGVITMKKYTIDSTISYALHFRDAQYTQIAEYDHISFNDTTEIKDFFSLVLTAIQDRQEYTVNIGDQTVFINKSLKGVASISTNLGFFYINQKEAQGIINSLK
jgi:hypothetical protein